MQFLDQYIHDFLNEADPNRQVLGNTLLKTKQSYDIHNGGNPKGAFQNFVDQYNWLGVAANKTIHNINQNLARNLPGALMQDYLIHLIIQMLEPYPDLDVFTEVRVEFGTYPTWKKGKVIVKQPSHLIDITIGYRSSKDLGTLIISKEPWPKHVISRLAGEVVVPLIGISSKIRVSQGEFFDWLGRDQLLTKGNPHCLSIQVGLRTEMDMSIVEICQVKDKFFVLGRGGETNVASDFNELERLIEIINEHLMERMQ